MKIYTKTGDGGETSLLGGTRVPKTHARIEAYGTIDELNSYIGLLRDQKVNRDREDFLIEIQKQLFSIGAWLALDKDQNKMKLPLTGDEQTHALEQAIDELDKTLPAMKNFILPGGHPSVSYCHIARCVCRRAERRVVQLADEAKIDQNIIKYLNRLSDYLFVLCRAMGKQLKLNEIPWKAF